MIDVNIQDVAKTLTTYASWNGSNFNTENFSVYVNQNWVGFDEEKRPASSAELEKYYKEELERVAKPWVLSRMHAFDGLAMNDILLKDLSFLSIQWKWPSKDGMLHAGVLMLSKLNPNGRQIKPTAFFFEPMDRTQEPKVPPVVPHFICRLGLGSFVIIRDNQQGFQTSCVIRSVRFMLEVITRCQIPVQTGNSEL